MSFLLEIENIDVYYGNIWALRKISLSVREGELVVVLGANGAGKTTLLKAISGVCVPRSGAIKLMNERIDGKHPSFIVRKGISHSPEGRKIFPKMTVLKNLYLGAYTRNDKVGIQEDLEGVFALFPILRKRRKQLAGSLSGGEQQMLAIARALMSRPRLLMLDEPSLGLAPVLVTKIAEYINKINQQGVTVLLVEQNARIALSIGDRGYVLERGKVALEGTCKELLNKKEVVEAYVGA